MTVSYLLEMLKLDGRRNYGGMRRRWWRSACVRRQRLSTSSSKGWTQVVFDLGLSQQLFKYFAHVDVVFGWSLHESVFPVHGYYWFCCGCVHLEDCYIKIINFYLFIDVSYVHIFKCIKQCMQWAGLFIYSFNWSTHVIWPNYKNWSLTIRVTTKEIKHSFLLIFYLHTIQGRQPPMLKWILVKVIIIKQKCIELLVRHRQI